MTNMEIYDRARSVPKEALKPIIGGRLKGMSDINPMWRLKMLTELFGVCGIGWKVELTDKRLERGHGDEVVCFVDINLYIRDGEKWSAPIPGMGGSAFVTAERNGVYTNDECFKMAFTDAISVACKSLGFAADVYFANDKSKYDTTPSDDSHTKPLPPPLPAPPPSSPEPPPAPPSVPTKTPAAGLISGGQLGMIKMLVKQKKVSDPDYRALITPKIHTNDLTSKEASALITKLQGM